MQQITQEEREILAQSMSQFRRTIIREFVAGIVRAFGNFDFLLPQMATLLLLDVEGELSIMQVAEVLGGPVAATCRLLVELVKRVMVILLAVEHYRIVYFVAITEIGRS